MRNWLCTDIICVLENVLQWYSFRTRLLSEDMAAKFVQFSDDDETREFLENCKEKSDQLFTQLFHSVVKCILSWAMNKTSINGYEMSQQQQSFYGPLSGTTRVSRYQKKHSPTHHPDHHPIFISFFPLLRSIASSLSQYWLYFIYSKTSQLHVVLIPLNFVKNRCRGYPGTSRY